MRAHATATFRFTAEGPMERVGPLFGADRERVWAPGWAPAFVHPAEAHDTDGMVFTVEHEAGASVWVNTQFDLAAGVVQYVYIVPAVLATRITLQLRPAGARTDVEVTYDRTALAPAGDERVRAMSAADAAAGPEWAAHINEYLAKSA
jgi:hypothetical protein